MRCVLVTGSWSSPTSVFALYCWGWESGNDTARLPASSLPARFPPPPGGGQWGGGGEPLLLGFTVGQLQARVGDVGTPAALTGGPFPGSRTGAHTSPAAQRLWDSGTVTRPL